MRPLMPLILCLALAACNAPPGTPEVSVSPESPTTLDDIVATLTQEAVDPNDDLIGYAYRWSVNGSPVEDLDGDTVPASRTRKGDVWEVFVIATDGAERVESAATGTTVVNSPPMVMARATDPAPRSEQDLELEITTEDADEDTVSLSYAWSRDGEATAHDGPTVPASDTTGGEIWEVVVTPDDGDMDGETETVVFSIENQAPFVVEATLSPLDPREGDTITLAVETEDPDGQDVDIEIAWTVDGVTVPGATGSTLSGGSFDKGQVVVAEITPTDGVLVGRTVKSNSVQVFNTAPTAASASLDATSADEATVIGCAGSGYSDVDGDPEGWQFEWLVDGKVSTTTPTIDGGSFDKGQSVQCRAFPYDGEDRGDAVTSGTLTIDNSPPTLVSVDLSSTSPKVGDTITAIPVGGLDPDGDPISYEISWAINGSSAGTGASLSSGFSKGDRITATITPTDGRDKGRPVTSAIATVANSIPRITVAYLTPSVVYTDTSVTPSFIAVDPDGDSVSVATTWSVNGSSVGSSLPTSAFKKGDAIQATVVPSDGTDTGVGFTTPPARVLNKAPTPPTLALSTLKPEVDEDDLVCRVTKASTDADADTITYIASWTEDGTAISGGGTTTFAGDTIDADDLKGGAKYVCSVKASDGTALSTAATSPTATATGGGLTSPGDIKSVGAPKVHETGRITFGQWFRDGKSPGKYYAMEYYQGRKALQEYNSLSDVGANRVNRTITLPVTYDGTGATMWDGAIYYNEGSTRNIVRVDLSTAKVTARRTLPSSAYYRNGAAYQWGGYSDIDMAVDSTGLYVIYATPSSSRRIVISKVDPTTLAITRTWTTTRTKTSSGNSWMIGGKLYVTNSYSSSSARIDYIYDTARSSGTSASIPFQNYRYNSMIDYNPSDRLLYSWDSGRLQTYSMTFK